MKRLAPLLCLIGCGGSSGAPGDQGTADLSVSLDFPPANSPLGGPCATNADCTAGTTPTCFASSLYNQTSGYVAPGGYCSSPCNVNADCGANGVCLNQGAAGKWCFVTCSVASDCRANGYRCFLGPSHCFPIAYLDCDPTAGDGTCTTPGGFHGGCLRSALGAGEAGTCVAQCEVGPGTCSNGRQCVVLDERTNMNTGVATSDVFVGPVCIRTNVTANPTGQICLDSASMARRLLACVDGDECYRAGFPGGDDTCHALCVEGGDGGAPVGDGGAPGCSAPETCHDLWGLFGSAHPVGLCY